jgi:lipid A disaccharide synthetase
MPFNLFISAGEASGEHYGALLIESLNRQLAAAGHSASFFGMGGDRMAAAGLHRVVRSEDMAVMGITEVVRHLPRIYREFRKLKQAVRAQRPDAAILIDFPDIHFKLAEEFHRLGVPVIFFVSPQLWAWKKHRIKLVQKYVTRMLVIFPFEEPFYRDRGVAAEFVGHPLADLPQPTISRDQFAAENSLDPAAIWIALLPGSRPKEIRANLPEMLAAARLLTSREPQTHLPENHLREQTALKGHGFSRANNSQIMSPALAAPNFQDDPKPPPQSREVSGHDFSRADSPTEKGRALAPASLSLNQPSPNPNSSPYQFLIPLAPTLTPAQRDEVRALVQTHASTLPIRLVEDARAALHHARAAIVASGTATVEAALIGNPFVVVYRVSPLTYAIAKRVVTVPHVAMCNLIAGKRVVPELIQNDFTAAKIVQQLEALLPDGPPRESMMQELSAIGASLRSRHADKELGAIDRVAAITLNLIVPASPALDPSAVQS